jgi:hypothetical protein
VINMNWKLGLMLVVTPLVLVACGKSEYKPATSLIKPKEYKLDPNNLANLFPFAEGNTWTYNMESSLQVPGKPAQNSDSEYQYKVARVVKESDTATRAILEVYRDGERKDDQEWLVDSTGLYQLSMGANRTAFNPKQIVLKFPIKAGEMVTWEGTGPLPIGGIGTLKYNFKAEELQIIDTDVKGETMKGLFVENAGTFKNDKGEGILAQNTWYVPGVGLARYKQVIKLKDGEAVLTLRLKSYTVK